MKNIHVLPTDKPSRLWVNNLLQGKLELSKEAMPYNTSQNIYITSNKEIKEGDCSFYPPFGVGRNIVIDGELCFHIEAKNGKGSFTQRTYQTLDRNKKIILTTDQDLIGIQPIDDEFLEWFVKNPSCEEVEVEIDLHDSQLGNGYSFDRNIYKIITPNEEPKQKTLTLTLNKESVQGLLECLTHTSASGASLDVGEKIEKELVDFINDNK